jgi:hypothetical protein
MIWIFKGVASIEATEAIVSAKKKWKIVEPFLNPRKIIPVCIQYDTT